MARPTVMVQKIRVANVVVIAVVVAVIVALAAALCSRARCTQPGALPHPSAAGQGARRCPPARCSTAMATTPPLLLLICLGYFSLRLFWSLHAMMLSFGITSDQCANVVAVAAGIAMSICLFSHC